MLRTNNRLVVVVPGTLVIILLLLYVSFRNMIAVTIIMGTLPLSIVGGIWFIYLLGYNLSFAVGVGFIALAEIAVEIGVLMIVYLNQALALKQKRS